MSRDKHPAPPDGTSLAAKVETIAPGETLWRIYDLQYEPTFFGARCHNRFDDPQRSYGVLYLGCSARAAFIETVQIPDPKLRIVDADWSESRGWARYRSERPLRLAQLYGPGLPALGLDSFVSGCSPYDYAQSWSRALYTAPENYDGIVYRANHDNDERAVALFDRAEDGIALLDTAPLLVDLAAFAEVLEHYEYGYLPN